MRDSTEWAAINKVYGDRGIALGLGAGVSIDSGLPTWVDLLRRVAESTPGVAVEDFDDLVRKGFRPQALATLLSRSYPDRVRFAEAVRQALYRDFNYFIHGYNMRDRRGLIDLIQAQNATLCAIGAVCATRAPMESGYRPNPRIKGIATFNLDALLQAYTVARFDARLLRTVERPSAGSSRSRIHIYHLHGFLRFDRKVGDRKREAPDAMVLTEPDYFDVFGNPFSIFTYTFLNMLREHTMLFIGLSMNDDNLRRLLYYSMKERSESYSAEGEDEAVSAERSKRHFAVLERPESSGYARSLENSLLHLGVSTAWVDEFGEIPCRLKEMYEGAGSRWSDVY